MLMKEPNVWEGRNKKTKSVEKSRKGLDFSCVKKDETCPVNCCNKDYKYAIMTIQ